MTSTPRTVSGSLPVIKPESLQVTRAFAQFFRVPFQKEDRVRTHSAMSFSRRRHGYELPADKFIAVRFWPSFGELNGGDQGFRWHGSGTPRAPIYHTARRTFSANN